MDNSNINEDLVRFSYNLGKGAYIEDLYYVNETKRIVKFKSKQDNKYCSIPKSFIQKKWKKDKNIPQNIYIPAYLAFFRIYWEKYRNLNK